MRLSALLAVGLFAVSAPVAFAQAPSKKMSVSQANQLRDGVFRQQGKVMRLEAGRVSRLSAPLVLADGATVRTDGLMVAANGRRQQLPDNHAITMQGTIVLLRDDMLSPRAIEQRAQMVVGSAGETRLAIPATPAAGSQLPPRLTASLLRAEQRLALLEEMTSQLEQRTRPVSAGTRPLDQQLSQVNAELRAGASAAGTATDVPQ